MRVLILTSQLHSGAAELLGVELAVALNIRGTYTDIVCMYSERMGWALKAKDGLLKRGVPNVYFLNLSVRPSFIELLRAVIKLRHLLLREEFDVIETSSPALGILASFACFGTPVFHVVGLHQTFYRCEHKSIRERLFAFCVRARKRTKFYAVSEFVRETWIKYSKVHSSRVRVVYNSIAIGGAGADCGKARKRLRSELGIPETSKVAICVGRLASYKRQDFVLDALGPICNKEDLFVLFIGEVDRSVPGTTEMLQIMEKVIARNALDGRVKFLGHREDIRDLMVSADILVHGTGKEAFGLVLAEAMAVGLPIVATHVEGIPEVLLDTHSMLVPPDDRKMLQIAVLKTLALTPEQIEVAKAKGKARAQMFAPKIRTEKLLQLFEDISSSRF